MLHNERTLIGKQIGKAMESIELYRRPSAMEPMFPERNRLEDRAIDLIEASAALEEKLHPITRRSVVELVRSLNSYYSNLIEGHATHLLDIERAMKDDFSSEPAKRARQVESRAHIEVDRLIDERLREKEEPTITSREFLRWIHREFYERMPDEFRMIRHRPTNEEVVVVPGELRDREVETGRHLAPASDAIPELLDYFSKRYDLSSLGRIEKVLAFAASHHRLLWIHPFLDGNGRVARLFTNAYARLAGISGYGLWTVSRGLARRRADYMSALAGADSSRRNDHDGRGNLSLGALTEFCAFFFETCLDQISFMDEILDLDGLAKRIAGYISLRSREMIPNRGPIREEARHLLVEAMSHGELERGETGRITGLGTRTARSLVSHLVDEGLLFSETPKGPLRLGIPAKVVSYYFPRLYAEEGVATPVES